MHDYLFSKLFSSDSIIYTLSVIISFYNSFNIYPLILLR